MPRPSQPLPDDFHICGRYEGNLKLRKRYSVCGTTIDRWRRESGVVYAMRAMPKKPTRPIMARKAKKRYQSQEQIEDLDDGFDLGTCLRTGAYGEW
jgi:hypothetical protein